MHSCCCERRANPEQGGSGMLKQMKLGFSYQGEMREIWINVVYSDRKTLGLEVGRDGHVTLRYRRKLGDKTHPTFAQQQERGSRDK